MSALARTLRRGLSTSATPKTLAKIDSLYHITDLDAFLSRLRRLSSSSPLPASIYAVASRRLASAGRHSEAAAILSSLAPRLPPPALIALYGKASLPDLAVQAYRSHPTLPSFNALLSALPPDAAVRHFDAAPASVSPDLASYTILVAALCRVGDLDRAARTLRLMEDNGVPPNAATFNALLSALYRSGRAEEAEAVWREMEEKGRGPNVRSYNAKMRWLVSARRTAEAVEIFSQMEAAGITPDGYSITALIVGYCNDGNLRQGKRLMEDLRRRKLDPTPWTYEALVPRMCEANELDSALSLCYESIRNRCYMGVGILQVVMDGLVGSSRVADARRLVEMAWSRHYTRDSLIMPRECLELIESEKQGKMQKEMKEREDGVKGSLVLSTVSGGEGEGSQKGTNNGGASAKIGIIVKSFDKPKYMGAFGVPPDKNRVKLPTTRTLITVLRSPHIDKKSREQFEMKVRREYITVKCQPHELQKKYFWFKRARVLGAQFELVFSYKTRLDMGRLKQSV